MKSSAGVDLRLGTSSLVDLAKVGLGSDNVKEGGFCGMKQSSEQIFHPFTPRGDQKGLHP